MHTRYIGRVAVAVLALGFIGWLVWPAADSNNHGASNDNGSVQRQPSVDMEELGAHYRAAVRDYLPRYEAALASGEQEDLESVQDDLLALQLPPADREAHVALVLLLDSRKNGRDASAAQTQLEQLKDQYPWLAVQPQ